MTFKFHLGYLYHERLLIDKQIVYLNALAHAPYLFKHAVYVNHNKRVDRPKG